MGARGTCSMMDRSAPGHLLTWLIGGLCALAFALGPGTVVASATDGGSPASVAPANIYVPVSILSPGDHGPVTQVNVSGAQATATNVTQATGQPGAAPAGQTAGASGGAAQQAPANVSAPVTVGGVAVGDHAPSQ